MSPKKNCGTTGKSKGQMGKCRKSARCAKGDLGLAQNPRLVCETWETQEVEKDCSSYKSMPTFTTGKRKQKRPAWEGKVEGAIGGGEGNEWRGIKGEGGGGGWGRGGGNAWW